MPASKLFTKLNLTTQTDIFVLNAPPGFNIETGNLEGVTVHKKLPRNGMVGFTLVFVTRRAEIDSMAKSLSELMPGDAVLWFAYPKKSAKNYSCDFSRDSGWDALGPLGFEAVRMVAVDEDWSALRFRRIEFIKSFKRDKSRAMTVKGRARAACGKKAG